MDLENYDFLGREPEKKQILSLWDTHPFAICRDESGNDRIAAGYEFEDPKSTLIPEDCRLLGNFLVEILDKTRKALNIENISSIESVSKADFRNNGRDLIPVQHIYVVGIDVDEQHLAYWRDTALYFLSRVTHFRDIGLGLDISISEKLPYIDVLNESITRFLKTNKSKNISETLQVSLGDKTVNFEQNFIQAEVEEPESEQLELYGVIHEFRRIKFQKMRLHCNMADEEGQKFKYFDVDYDPSEFTTAIIETLRDEEPRKFIIIRQVTESASGREQTHWSLRGISPIECSENFELKS